MITRLTVWGLMAVAAAGERANHGKGGVGHQYYKLGQAKSVPAGVGGRQVSRRWDRVVDSYAAEAEDRGYGRKKKDYETATTTPQSYDYPPPEQYGPPSYNTPPPYKPPPHYLPSTTPRTTYGPPKHDTSPPYQPPPHYGPSTTPRPTYGPPSYNTPPPYQPPPHYGPSSTPRPTYGPLKYDTPPPYQPPAHYGPPETPRPTYDTPPPYQPPAHYGPPETPRPTYATPPPYQPPAHYGPPETPRPTYDTPPPYPPPTYHRPHEAPRPPPSFDDPSHYGPPSYEPPRKRYGPPRREDYRYEDSYEVPHGNFEAESYHLPPSEPRDTEEEDGLTLLGRLLSRIHPSNASHPLGNLLQEDDLQTQPSLNLHGRSRLHSLKRLLAHGKGLTETMQVLAPFMLDPAKVTFNLDQEMKNAAANDSNLEVIFMLRSEAGQKVTILLSSEDDPEEPIDQGLAKLTADLLEAVAQYIQEKKERQTTTTPKPRRSRRRKT